MDRKDFFDSEVTRKAYLGKHAFDFMSMAARQATVIYVERGLIFPMEVSSTLQYLNRQGALSVADIARALDLPHQLATQRVEKLIKLSLVVRKPDPRDARRSMLKLTQKGRSQAKLLEKCMKDVAELYQELFDEINCDLSKILPTATNALRQHPLSDRLARKQNKTKKTCDF